MTAQLLDFDLDDSISFHSAPKRRRTTNSKKKSAHTEWEGYAKVQLYLLDDINHNPGHDWMFPFASFELNVVEEDRPLLDSQEATNVTACHLYYVDNEESQDSMILINDLTLRCRPLVSYQFLSHCKSSVVRLTYRRDFSNILVWVRKTMFAETIYGDRITATSALQLSKLMTISAETSDAGPQLSRKSDDLNHFYSQLKQFQRSNLALDATATDERMNPRHPDLLPILRPYQRQAVSWLLQRETGNSMAHVRAVGRSPLIRHVRDVRKTDQKDAHYYYCPDGGYFITELPPQPSPVVGGILAEEMGLGKTVEILALILLHPKRSIIPVACSPRQTDVDPDIALVVEDLVSSVVSHLETDVAFQRKALAVKRYKQQKLNEARRKVVFPPKMNPDSSMTARMQCLCTRSPLEANPSPRIVCKSCNTWQHSGCVRWMEDMKWSQDKDYYCFKCRHRSPELMVDSKTTLIVSPATLSDQWYAEIQRHVRNGTLDVYVYRGIEQEGYVQPLQLAEYDIVIVAYETLKKELNYVEAQTNISFSLRRPKRYTLPPSPLVSVKWWRLCLDEAQLAENVSVKAARMCQELTAVNKWCVSGTPLQRSIDDLYGLFLLLNVDIYSHRHFWEGALQRYRNGQNDLLEVVAPLLWRSCKADVLYQMQIPAQEQELCWVDFGPVEQHFYRRTLEKCARQFDEARTTLQNVDPATKLSDLDRYDIDRLLRPLLKLRQACCHPLLVKKKRAKLMNSDRSLKANTVVTMDAVLEEMIKKTVLECEETHRSYVASLNGLAGLAWIEEKWEDAIDYYREALRSCELCLAGGEEQSSIKSAVRTDPLQKVHALHNLAELLVDYADGAELTTRDQQLLDECSTLTNVYLTKTNDMVQKAFVELDQCPKLTTELKHVQSTPWFIPVLEGVSRYAEEAASFMDKAQIVLARTRWGGQVRDISGLIYLLLTNCEKFNQARFMLLESTNELNLNSKELLDHAQLCHLRPVKDVVVEPCPICKIEKLSDDYESKLFNFDESVQLIAKPATENENEDAFPLRKLRRGTWSDGNLELAMKFLFGYASRADWRSLVNAELLQEAKSHMKLFEMLKKEFKSLRAYWLAVAEYVAKNDELRMAKQRLEVVEGGNEPRRCRFTSEKLVAQNAFLRHTSQLAYLENLRLQQNKQADCNMEECPICKVELGEQWCFLICGHSLCEGCFDTLTSIKTASDKNFSCPLCRQNGRLDQVRRVMNRHLEKALAVEAQPKELFFVSGDHSSKITAVTRKLLEIRHQQPSAKCLVFSGWIENLELMCLALKENGVNHVLLNGTPGSEAWRASMSRFKASADCHVLLLNINSGANGLNIIEATHVLLVEPALNTALELQALGRVHRIGQRFKTIVHRFLIRNTVEEKMHVLLAQRSTHTRRIDKNNDDNDILTMADLIDMFVSIDWNATIEPCDANTAD